MGATRRRKEYQSASPDRTRDSMVPPHPPKDATLTGVTHGLGRVLVVDDDEVIRRLIAVNLQLEGADAYLTKPFDPNEMIRVIRELAGVAPLSPPSPP